MVGCGMALAAIFMSMIMEGGNPAAIILPPALVIVFGGTIGVSVAGGVMRDAKGLIAGLKNALLSKSTSVDETIGAVVSMAERARREGILALEEASRSIEDPFLRKGIELAIDGTDTDELKAILNAEVSAKRASDRAAAKLFKDMSGFAPTMGIIGTVLGLIHVLENLSEPDKLGHLIAGAFVATLWGVLSANVLWLPMANKLARISEIECRHMQLVVEGVLSVQAGANPRVIEQKLWSQLPPAERSLVEAAELARQSAPGAAAEAAA
jgi:chemotaxis protein MotA